MTEPLILAIDTSCDETCAAVACGRKILSNVIDSQINIHAQYGGVVPHLAKRCHEAKIEFVVAEAIKNWRRQANFTRATSHLVQPDSCEHVKISSTEPESHLDAIAVTVGPGLAPALEVGINFAKNLALKLNKPLIAINHLEGHLLSSLAKPKERRQANFTRATSHLVQPDSCEHVKISSAGLLKLPALGLIASGGHTELVLIKKIGDYQLLGQTLDDACGEALDKLAKMLKLGYPGGPIIEQLAKNGNPDAIPLPVPMQHSQDLNFSFSGLKTAALYLISPRGVKFPHPGVDKTFTYNLCASFQQSISISLCTKLKKAIKQYQPQAILLGGGVFSNLYLRRQIRQKIQPFGIPIYLPYSKKLYTDNAAMIAIAAQHHFLDQNFVKDIPNLDRQPTLNFNQIN